MKTVAIVEDNPDNRLLVRAILGEAYVLAEYETGPAALEGLRSSPADLILLDISLPDMDGVEVLREIRRDERLRDLPIIALTAYAMAGDRERYLSMGFDDYLTKPILEERTLLDAVERGLGGTR